MILNQKFELVAVKKLKVHPSNPNTGDVTGIANSIRENGFYGYVIADQTTKEILVGNHRYQAAISVGLKNVPTIWVNADAKTAAWLLAKDNEISHFGYRDERTLLELLKDLGDLEGTGYNEEELDDLMVYLRRIDPGTFAPPPEIKPDENDQERYDAQATYYISLDYAPPEYPEIIELFEKLMQKHNATTFAEAWVKECSAL